MDSRNSGANLLVRIQGEHPRLGGMAEGQVLLFAKTVPGMPEDFRAKGSGDVFRAVLHVLVQNHHDFRGPPGDAVQQAADPLGFRPGNNADRNGQFFSGHASRVG